MLRSDQARINITSGGVFLKYEKASNPTRGIAKTYGKGIIDTEGREIFTTHSFKITGKSNFSKFIQQVNILRDGQAGPVNKQERIAHKDFVAKTKFSGNSRQRKQASKPRQKFKAGLKKMPGTKGAVKAGLIGFIVGVTLEAMVEHNNKTISDDFTVAYDQLSKQGRLAFEIVMDNHDIIDDNIINDSKALADLSNFIFQGEITDDDHKTYESGTTKEELERIGSMIILRDDRVRANIPALLILRKKLDKIIKYNNEKDLPELEHPYKWDR